MANTHEGQDERGIVGRDLYAGIRDPEASVWSRMAERLLRCVRRQTATIGIGAIVALCWLTGVRAQHTAPLIAAFLCVVGIAVFIEWRDDQHIERP